VRIRGRARGARSAGSHRAQSRRTADGAGRARVRAPARGDGRDDRLARACDHGRGRRSALPAPGDEEAQEVASDDGRVRPAQPHRAVLRTKELHKIKPDDIERYIAAKRGTLAIKTIRNHVATVRSCFELGLRKGWCQSNPVKLADRPVIKKTETHIRFLDQDELEQLLASTFVDDAFGSIERALYLTTAMTGLRQGELLGLRWRDVDFDARKVRVASPCVRGEFGDPKSEGSGRSVPMASRVAEPLLELREQTLFKRPSHLAFCHPETGNPLDRSKLVRRFRQQLDRAGVRRVTFHELRHTFGTRMAAAGTLLRTIQRWMGHADAKTT
jgi:integrase